jgi:hypothetical protein
MIQDASDTTFRVHGLVQTVERVRAEEEGYDIEARGRALWKIMSTQTHSWTYIRKLRLSKIARAKRTRMMRSFAKAD